MLSYFATVHKPIKYITHANIHTTMRHAVYIQMNLFEFTFFVWYFNNTQNTYHTQFSSSQNTQTPYTNHINTTSTTKTPTQVTLLDRHLPTVLRTPHLRWLLSSLQNPLFCPPKRPLYTPAHCCIASSLPHAASPVPNFPCIHRYP